MHFGIISIFADGMYCKGRTDDGGARKRDVKVIVGVRQSSDVFPIGTWTGDETWTDIGNELERRKVKFAEFSNLRRWLALGIVRPRASSLIERTMRGV